MPVTDIAARVLVTYDGIVDKFVGDEVVGIFIPALVGGLLASPYLHPDDLVMLGEVDIPRAPASSCAATPS